MTSLIHRLFGPGSDATVLCPRCEHAMEGHDDADCARKMSRRWFIGMGVAAAVAMPVGIYQKIWRPHPAQIKALSESYEVIYSGGYSGGRTSYYAAVAAPYFRQLYGFPLH